MVTLYKPKIIDEFEIKQNSLKIRFLPDPSGLDKITSWTLNADTSTDFYGANLENAVQNDEGQRTIYIDRLKQYTKYYLRMFGSTSKDGDTPSSSVVSIRTLPGLPKASTTTYLVADGQNAFHVLFTAPTDIGGSPISGQSSPPITYDVGYGENPDVVQFTSEKNANGDVYVRGLKSYTKYYVWTRVVNAAGPGPWSARMDVRTRAPLTESPDPMGAFDVGMFELTYKFTDGDTHGPPIDERQIAYNTDPYNVANVTSVPPNYDVPIQGLTPATNWYVWSRQRTQEGWSAWSARTDVTTAAGARVFLNGQWRLAIPYVKKDGSWHMAQPYVRRTGLWKRTA